MNKLDLDYQALLADILKNGYEKMDRTGTGTISVFGRTIRHKMSDGFPLLTTKKMYTKGIIVELLWFLQGGTNIKYLVDNGCNIWNGDCYKKYKTYAENLEEPDYSVHIEDPSQNCTRILSIEEFVEKIKTDTKFSAKWGELGPTYGKQWRQWQGWLQTEDGIMGSLWYDQILRLINDLKTNPNSRRLIINAWNVAEVDKMTLPPCHYSFQCYTRELSTEERNAWLLTNRCGGNISVKHDWEDFELDQQNIPSRELSLSWNQRSCDFPLGIPFNIASYGFLLSILANEVNMVTGELIGNLGDCHIYLNQIEGVKEQIGREYTLGERLEFCSTEERC